MVMDDMVAKPETYGLRPGWTGGTMGMMTIVRVVTPETLRQDPGAEGGAGEKGRRAMKLLALVARRSDSLRHQRRRRPPTPPPITLNELEQLALQNNPTATAAAAGIDAARERTRQAGAWPNPVIGYSGEEIKTGDLDTRGEHGFFVEQTIPLGGKLGLSRSVFQKTIERAEAVRDLQRLRILSSVRQAFYSVLLTERRIEVQERLAALASEAVGVTAQLFNVGAADRPDYLRDRD